MSEPTIIIPQCDETVIRRSGGYVILTQQSPGAEEPNVIAIPIEFADSVADSIVRLASESDAP